MENCKPEMMTSIKIVVPTLNSYLFLPKLIKSIQSQTFSKWSILFVDGESNHNHREFIKEYCSKEKRCEWIEQSITRKGIFGAMNQGFHNTGSNEWLLFWGSDDWAATPYVFEQIINIVETYKPPLPDLIVCKGRYINSLNNIPMRKTTFLSTKGNTVLLANYFRNKLFWGSTPPHQATIFGPGARSKLRRYSEDFRLSADLDFFLKLSTSKNLKVLNSDLEIVHMSDGGISGIQTQKRLSEVRLAYKNTFGFMWWFPFLMRYIKKLASVITYS